MKISDLKKYLESYFHIGFQIKQSNNELDVFPASFNDDGFHVLLRIENDVRLIAIAEPQKYGASILKMIKKSTYEKRLYCVKTSELITKGNFQILINNIEKTTNEFIDYKGEWDNFSIKNVVFPLDNEKYIYESSKILISMFLSLLNYSIEGYSEGEKEQIISYKYERNPINREICLMANGYRCVVCGFDFEKKYGEVGEGVIEVHHTTPVSQMGEHYVVDPVNEMVPVCSNCHTIIHRRKTPYSINDVKKMIKENQNG